MNRREFTRKTRAFVHARAAGACEACGAALKIGEGEYDHILADELGGEPTADNCRLICTVCHKAKTADDIRAIRKADRVRDRHNGTLKPSYRPIAGSRASGQRKRMSGAVERWPT